MQPEGLAVLVVFQGGRNVAVGPSGEHGEAVGQPLDLAVKPIRAGFELRNPADGRSRLAEHGLLHRRMIDIYRQIDAVLDEACGKQLGIHVENAAVAGRELAARRNLDPFRASLLGSGGRIGKIGVEDGQAGHGLCDAGDSRRKRR